MKIEAEGSELVLKNSHGDIAIIPKKDRNKLIALLNNGCHSCIDNYIKNLPTQEDYAGDGTVVKKESNNSLGQENPTTNSKSAEKDNYVLVKKDSGDNDVEKYSMKNQISSTVNSSTNTENDNVSENNDAEILNSIYKPIIKEFSSTKKCNTTNCSEFSTTELANLFGYDRKTVEPLVATDAWYKIDKVLKNKGKLLYENPTKGKLPDKNFDWSNLDLKIGDFVELSNGQISSHVKNSPSISKEGYKRSDYGRHSGIIVGFTEDGIPLVRHNFNGRVFTEPINKINRTFNYFPNRIARTSLEMHPELLKKRKTQELLKRNYNPTPTYSLSEYTKKEEIGKDLIDTYNKLRKDISINYAISPKEADKIFTYLMGISAQESNVNNSMPINSIYDVADQSKQLITDVTPEFTGNILKGVSDLGTLIKNTYLSNFDGRKELSDFEKEKLARELVNKKEAANRKEALQIINKIYKSSPDNYHVYDKSYGPFKQKNPSQYWLRYFEGLSEEDNPYHPSNWGKEWNDNIENLLLNAFGLFLENRDKLKKMYPNKSEKFYNDLAALMHNSPKKALSPEQVKFFYENGDDEFNFGYLKKILEYRKKLFNLEENPQ